jgi:GTP cyclohydrolase I
VSLDYFLGRAPRSVLWSPDNYVPSTEFHGIQLQERLTEQVSKVVMEEVGAKGVGVMIEARHLCMMMRGVEKQNSTMVTSSVLGVFRDNLATREEFLNLVARK